MSEQDDSSEELISKSQRKRQAHSAQALGEILVKLPLSVLKKVDLPEDVRDAVLAAQKIHAHGGHKRQLQYIGKLMRSIDIEPIQLQLERFNMDREQASSAFHDVERWRDRLLADFDGTLAELLEVCPNLDRQFVRQLVRNAQKELASNKPPKSKRLLFQHLKEIL